jgi:rubredoxin
LCGYVYYPSENNNISFEDLPADWVCPLCQAGKEDFQEIE